ncbi:MAG: polyribonucleotide nucleotidyltransferase, partial [Planctomycetota bacterium]|nr:polyribonucleotide nucleotidyltransferase [Planctomycetota bacterium]
GGTMWTKTVKIGDHEIEFETGVVARQASGSIIVRQGKLTLLCAVTGAQSPKDGDFLPLTVSFTEHFSAAGSIPGNFFKREGRATEQEILVSRFIDRSIRPLFADNYRFDTQAIVTLLSYDPDVDVGSLALTGTAMALAISDLPFGGPVAAYRIGFKNNKWLGLPSYSDRKELDLDFIIAAKRDGIVMAEGCSDEVTEQHALEAFKRASDSMQPLFDAIDEAKAAVGKEKRVLEELPSLPEEIVTRVTEKTLPGIKAALTIAPKHERARALKTVQKELKESFEDDLETAKEAFGKLKKKEIRATTLANKRVDGRDSTTIRDITGRVSWLPTPHGSALFTRGETQAMVTATLGSDRDAQLIDGPDGNERRRFILHYNFPPYSVGETRPMRGPGRREIGHGNLAWHALQAVLPKGESFPYTLRVESIISESNGSSSMATVCGACLSLMDAGVPLKRPVAGIAMGLIQEGDETIILSDILGDEDHIGDMDFKVAGTSKGITAIQLDNKIGSLSSEIMEKAFEQARQGRLHILGEMAKILPAARSEFSAGVPRAIVKQIPLNRMRSLIGPGGKNIKRLEAESECQVSVDDEGLVRIFAPGEAALQKALDLLDDLTGLPRLILLDRLRRLCRLKALKA